MYEDKADKFIRVAERRVNNAVKAIRVVGGLSNKNVYEFTDDQIEKILKAMTNEIDALVKHLTCETTSEAFKLRNSSDEVNNEQ